MTAPITVVIADDHAVLREGLAALVDDQPDMRVVAQASDGAELLARCREHEPNVAVVDLAMPVLGGLEAIDVLAAEHSGVRTLALTMYDDDEHLRRVMAAGATGFLAKAVAARALIEAIRAVHQGRPFVRVGRSSYVPRWAAPVTAAEPAAPCDALSPREREVLSLLAYGHTSKEIGAALRLSPKSVESYRERLYDKLGTRDRAKLVCYAATHGILDPSAPIRAAKDGA